MQTIFYILPKLCHVIDEELIPACKFVEYSTVWKGEPSPVKVCCDNNWLLVALRDVEASGQGSGTRSSGVETRSIAHKVCIPRITSSVCVCVCVRVHAHGGACVHVHVHLCVHAVVVCIVYVHACI